MRLYWTIREQVRSELDGGVKSKEQRKRENLDAREFDSESAARSPDVGWD